MNTYSATPALLAAFLRVRQSWGGAAGVSLLLAALVLIGCSLAAPVAAQGQTEVHILPRTNPAPEAPDPSLKTHTTPFKSEVDLVLVPVTVTDPYDRLVTGLEKQNFAVYEGGHQEQIRHLSSEDAPISLGVIFDISGSMSNKIDKAREAVVSFMQTANPQDEFFMIAFSDQPELLSGFTNSIGDIQGRLATTQPKGRTALLDAIYLGLQQMRRATHERKALLIISDGGDNHSRYTESEVRSVVREADVQIFAIGLFDEISRTSEESFGPTLLSDITDETGGRTYTVGNPNELTDVATKISVALRNEYVIGYHPVQMAKDGKWHKIQVKLHPPKGLPPLNVHAKKGYYAPERQ